MTEPTGPTTRRRQLGAGLKRLREETARLTLEEAAAETGIAKSNIHRYEGPTGGVKRHVVEVLCRAYGASDAEREALVAIAANAKQLGWYMSHDIPGWIRTLYMLEDEASELCHFAPGYVPGIVQTEAYALAAHRASEPRATSEELERMVRVRMKRQEVLRRENPPHLWLILDEGPIRRQVGGPAIMAEQMASLLSAAESPKITLQILPFTAGANAAEASQFVIIRGAQPSLDVVYLGHQTSALYLEKPDDLARYRMVFDYLRSEALDSTASAALLTSAAKEYAEAARKESQQ